MILAKRPSLLLVLTVAATAAGGALLAPAPLPAQTEEVPRVWEGTVTYAQTLDWDTDVGEVVARIEMDVRWGERERLDVIDEDGRAVGQLVILQEQGSSWTGTLSGTTTRETACDVTVNNYNGFGRGSSTIQTGWVYFSLVEDDPLAARIPSGAYHVVGDSTQRFEGTLTSTTERFCRNPGSRTTTVEYPGGIIGFRMGKEPITWPNPVAGGQLPAAAVLQAYEQADAFNFDALPVAHTDNDKRRLVDGAMTGSFVAGAENLKWDAVWDVRRMFDTRVVLDTVDRDWLPGGGNDANEVRLTARIEAESLEGRFRFRLADVTEEPGYALNAGDSTDKDLEFAAGQAGFDPAEETADGWTIEGTEAVREKEIVVAANDYGAWGRLTCEVILDGEWHPCETEAGADSAFIPVDEDGDLIADSWAEEFAVAGGADDADATPSGTEEDDDGLSNYEEYRGVMVQGIHERTDPAVKTLFLRDDQGIARATTALLVFDLYYLAADEVGGTDGPVVNPNQCSGAHADHHLADQYAVNVTNGGLSNSWNWGCAFPCEARFLGPPSSCTEARTYVPQIAVDMGRFSGGAYAGLASTMTNQVVDHEIGHCIGAHHHNVDAPATAATEEDGPVCTMRYYFERIFGKTITAADIGRRFCSSISMPKIDLSDPS